MARKKIGIEEQILDYVESGPVAAVELTMRLANARFKKRMGPAAVPSARRTRKKKDEAAETASA